MNYFSLPIFSRCVILVVFVLNASFAFSQKNNFAKQTFFVEGGGASPYYSINYAHRILASENVTGYLRLGGSVWGEGVAFPTGFSFLWGNNDHHPELTLAMTPNFEGARFWDRDRSDLLLDLVLGLGYRYQPEDESFFIGAGLYPYIRLDPTQERVSEKKAELRFRFGGSIGWLF